MFSGARLRVARMFHGLTQRELADKVAVSNGMIAALENGAKQPGDELRDAVCTALEVQPSYFSALHTDEFQENESNFRRRITATEKLKRQVLARASMFGMITGYLRGYELLPQFNFPDFSADRLEEIELIADRARTYWELGIDAPIGDVSRVAELNGAVILNIDIDTAKQVDAFSRFGESSVIVLNTRMDNPSRTRFSLAHEIAHGVLHQGARRSMPLDEKEKQADCFAGAFLLPLEAFTVDFREHHALDWEGLLEMKRYWRVSLAAMLRRAYQLSLIDAVEYRTRTRRLSSWGWREAEPEEPAAEEPTAFLGGLERVFSEYGRTVHDVIKDVGLSRSMFEKATGVPVPERDIAKVFAFSHWLRVENA